MYLRENRYRFATFLSRASLPSFTRQTVLPPAEDSTVTVASTRIPRFARCFFVLSSATIFTILTSRPMGASTNGIRNLLLRRLPRRCSHMRTYLLKKLFVFANYGHILSRNFHAVNCLNGIFSKKVRGGEQLSSDKKRGGNAAPRTQRERSLKNAYTSDSVAKQAI